MSRGEWGAAAGWSCPGLSCPLPCPGERPWIPEPGGDRGWQVSLPEPRRPHPLNGARDARGSSAVPSRTAVQRGDPGPVRQHARPRFPPPQVQHQDPRGRQRRHLHHGRHLPPHQLPGGGERGLAAGGGGRGGALAGGVLTRPASPADPVPEAGGPVAHHGQHPDEPAQLTLPRHLHHPPVPDAPVRPARPGEQPGARRQGRLGRAGGGGAECLQRRAGQGPGSEVAFCCRRWMARRLGSLRARLPPGSTRRSRPSFTLWTWPARSG